MFSTSSPAGGTDSDAEAQVEQLSAESVHS